MSYLQDKLDGKTVLLLTPTGSRLYGLHNKDSDYDYWAVVLEGNKGFHKVVGEEDVAVIPLSLFQKMLNDGVPQAMEALFSTQAEFPPPAWEQYMRRLRPNLWAARRKLLKPQHTEKKKMAGEPLTAKEFRKGKMHKTRLALQWVNMSENGYFNPTLTGEQLELVLYAGSDEGNWVPSLVHKLAMNTSLHGHWD